MSIASAWPRAGRKRWKQNRFIHMFIHVYPQKNRFSHVHSHLSKCVENPRMLRGGSTITSPTCRLGLPSWSFTRPKSPIFNVTHNPGLFSRILETGVCESLENATSNVLGKLWDVRFLVVWKPWALVGLVTAWKANGKGKRKCVEK